MKANVRYNMQRERAQYAQRRRHEEAIARSPRIEDLLETRAALLTQYALALADGEDAAPVEARIDDATRAIEAELLALGYGADYLDYTPVCALCGDSGWADGRPCSCGKTDKDTPTFKDYDVLAFPEGRQREQAQRALRLAEAYVERYPGNPQPNLFITGATGLGKTFMLYAIAGELSAKGVRARIMTAYELVEGIMREVIRGRDHTYLHRLEEAPLLVLDDLGTEPNIANVTNEYMFGLINERLVRRNPMLIASNLSPAEIERRYGARIASRLFDTRNTLPLLLEGVDLRTIRRRDV